MPTPFEKMQGDLSYPDAQVHWMGRNIRLHDGPKTLAFISAEIGAEIKIRRWCEKNGYRCSALRDGGRVWI